MVLMLEAWELYSLVQITPGITLKETLHNISNARKIAVPDGDFIVIATQPEVRAIHRELRIMLTEQYPRIASIHVLSQVNELQAKVDLLTRIGATHYTDTDEGMLYALNHAFKGRKKLLLMKNGVRIPIKPPTAL
jgi:hypothetical protein